MLIVIISGVILILGKKINETGYKKYIWGTFLAIIINSYANSIAGAFQMHYMLTFIPLICICSGLFIRICDKIPIKYILKVILVTIIVIATSLLPYELYIEITYKRTKKVPENAYAAIIIQYIEKTTNPDDLVQFIGGRVEATQANYKSKRLSASRYSYLPLWPTFTKERKSEMTNELVGELKETKPKLIIICNYSNKNSDPISDKDEFYELIEDKESWNKFLEEIYLEPFVINDYFILYNRKY